MKKDLWIIWKHPISKKTYKIGILTLENNTYRFVYVNSELEEARKNGYMGYPGFSDFSKVYENNVLFANIKTRLPNPKRPDYLEILNYYNLETNSSDFDILKATKGKLVTDNYEFVSPFDANKLIFNISGTELCSDIEKCLDIIKVNDELLLEITNKGDNDINSIKVIYVNNGNTYHLGYVPRYYSNELGKLLLNDTPYSAMVYSVNCISEIKEANISVLVKLIYEN